MVEPVRRIFLTSNVEKKIVNIVTKNNYNFGDINNIIYNGGLAIKALEAVKILELVKREKIILYNKFINKNIGRNFKVN